MCGTALAADRTKTAQMPPPCAGLYVGSDSLGLSGGFADEGQSSSAAEASQYVYSLLLINYMYIFFNEL